VLHTCKVGTLLLEPHLHFALVNLEMESHELFPLKPISPDPKLPSSKDYRHEPPVYLDCVFCFSLDCCRWYWSLNSCLMLARKALLGLEPLHQPFFFFFALGIFKTESLKPFA
jgi:hypothetical protein